MGDEQDWKDYPVHVGLLFSFAAGLVLVLGSFIGVQTWIDNRIDDRLSGYADKNIIPRLVAVERSIANFSRRQQEIIDTIESQDQSRNRQYGEIKKNQETIQELISNKHN